MSDNEIPGMFDGLCWSDLPLSDEEVADLKMAGVFDDGPDEGMTQGKFVPYVEKEDGEAW